MNEKYSLEDSDIVVDTVSRSNKNNVVRSGNMLKFNTVLFSLAIGITTLTSCTDDKTCSDVDRGDPAGSGRYDMGANQDSFDFGNDSDVGDPLSRGRRCADFD